MEHADIALAQILCHDALYGSWHAQRLFPALSHLENFLCFRSLPWILHWVLSFLQWTFLTRSVLETYGRDGLCCLSFKKNARVTSQIDEHGRTTACATIFFNSFLGPLVEQLPELLQEYIRIRPCHYNHHDCPWTCPAEGSQRKERETAKVSRWWSRLSRSHRIIHDDGNCRAGYCTTLATHQNRFLQWLSPSRADWADRDSSLRINTIRCCDCRTR